MVGRSLPSRILYATSARIGGHGLDAVVYETLCGIQDQLGLAITYGNRALKLDSKKLKSLQSHPVRLLSNLQRKYYYSAKKRVVDRVASRALAQGSFDLFHGWSGEALRSLRIAEQLGIPSVLEIPTWHRQKGRVLPEKTKEELAVEQAPYPRRWLNRLLVSRHETLEEYRRADLLLVLSEKAAESFRVLGVPDTKLFRMSRGVDVIRFRPASKPPVFRALFVGALIKRKGVHHLIEVWKELRLPNAELWLAGSAHRELQPFLDNLPSNVRVLGFVKEVELLYQQCTVHIFPSELEGSAKSTYEAAACGLAQIATRESGDIVVDGLNGIIIPPNDRPALARAIQQLYLDPVLVERLGAAGRERVVEQFTWDHFRDRVRLAYRTALAKHERAAETREAGSP